MEKSKEKKEKKFNYKEQFGVIVICESESEQIDIFNELLKKGLKLKVVTV
jgi:predicted 3-demethylubiquinone-9 3-methyltransferase (glyoxalase superfamily)